MYSQARHEVPALDEQRHQARARERHRLHGGVRGGGDRYVALFTAMLALRLHSKYVAAVKVGFRFLLTL